MPEKQLCGKCGKPIIKVVKEGVGVWFHQIEFGDCDLTPEPQILCKHCGKPKGEHLVSFNGVKRFCNVISNSGEKAYVFEPAPIKANHSED